VKRLHLLISCPGGSVFHGLSIYNFLRGAPIEVFTYNFGSVDSIGVVIFCAGSKRFSVPHARFLIHGITASIDAGTSLDERALEEVLKGIKIDYENIARVISDTTGQKIAKVMADMNDRTTLSPHESVAYGLVHSEISALFPAGADLYVVGENVAAQLAH
jgi:ATP-dependent protease ClpP protease subunit